MNVLVTRNDSYYIDGIRVGKQPILDQVYEVFFPKIRHFITQHSGTLEDAKDIFQDALLVVYQNVSDKDFQLTCQFGTYFYAICRNIWFRQIRDKKLQFVRMAEEPSAIDTEELAASIQWLARYKIYKRQFKRITGKCQQLLTLYMQGMDMHTIAQQLGFASVTYARKRKFKCKEQLVSRIKEDEDFQKLRDYD